MNRIQSLVFFCALVSLSVCDVSVVDKESEDSPAPVTPNAAYSVIPLDEPNAYSITFRSDLKARLLNGVQIQNLSTAGAYQGGQSYDFLVEGADGPKNLTVQIPKDLVIDTPMTAPGENPWKIVTEGRVFLMRNALLTTLDHDLQISAREIIFEEAQIETFHSNDRAVAGQDGRNGGKITLKASRLSGRLQVFLRGEDGGDGFAGAVQPPAADGISYGGGTHYSYCDPKYSPYILGGRGADGARGLPGGNGGRGGEGGALILETNDQTALTLSVEKSPGTGGIAGAGGPGQAGGRGGASGLKKWPLDRPAAEGNLAFPACGPDRGPDGTPGPAGEDGRAGNPGGSGRVCTVHDGQMKCE